MPALAVCEPVAIGGVTGPRHCCESRVHRAMTDASVDVSFDHAHQCLGAAAATSVVEGVDECQGCRHASRRSGGQIGSISGPQLCSAWNSSALAVILVKANLLPHPSRNDPAADRNVQDDVSQVPASPQDW